jgi:hypothetical protein
MPEKEGTTKTSPPIVDEGDGNRWLIVVFVLGILLGLAMLGWHYRASGGTDILCANAEARCGDKADGNPQ